MIVDCSNQYLSANTSVKDVSKHETPLWMWINVDSANPRKPTLMGGGIRQHPPLQFPPLFSDGKRNVIKIIQHSTKEKGGLYSKSIKAKACGGGRKVGK